MRIVEIVLEINPNFMLGGCADPEKGYFDGISPFAYAIKFRPKLVLPLLEAYKFKDDHVLTCPNHEGETPLMTSIEKADYELTKSIYVMMENDLQKKQRRKKNKFGVSLCKQIKNKLKDKKQKKVRRKLRKLFRCGLHRVNPFYKQPN